MLSASLVALGLAVTAAGAPTAIKVTESQSSIVIIARLESAEGAPTERALTLTPDDWEAAVCFDAAAPYRSSVQFYAEADSLKIDKEEARKLAGLNPADARTGDEARAIERKLREYVMATEYPRLKFQSLSARPENGKLLLEGPAIMRGKILLASIPMTVEAGDPETLWFRGVFTLRLTGFHAQPPALSDELRIADVVEIRFSVAGRNTGKPCS
jgi:hypothetical protein